MTFSIQVIYHLKAKICITSNPEDKPCPLNLTIQDPGAKNQQSNEHDKRQMQKSDIFYDPHLLHFILPNFYAKRKNVSSGLRY